MWIIFGTINLFYARVMLYIKINYQYNYFLKKEKNTSHVAAPSNKIWRNLSNSKMIFNNRFVHATKCIEALCTFLFSNWRTRRTHVRPKEGKPRWSGSRKDSEIRHKIANYQLPIFNIDNYRFKYAHKKRRQRHRLSFATAFRK